MKSTKAGNILVGYLRWPLYLSLILVVLDIYLFVLDPRCGVVAVIFTAGYIIATVVMYLIKRNTLHESMIRFADNFGQVQRRLVRELSVPYAILDTDCRLLWENDAFSLLVSAKSDATKSVSSVFPEITKAVLPTTDEKAVLHVDFGDQHYRIELRKITTSELGSDPYWNAEVRRPLDPESNALIACFVYDETELLDIKQENYNERLIIGLLYIDNYEEALESIDEVRRSLLTALVDRKINKYFQNIDAVIKKLEKDKYIVIFKQQYMNFLKSGKFSILDEIRSVNIGNDMSVTLSLGIGIDYESFTRAYDFSRAAIDLALGRGGDQVVLKSESEAVYFGGKTATVEKSTRVKARVKAHALKEFISNKERVLVMGHSNGDVDSFGASIGVYRISKYLGKRCYIVVDKFNSGIEQTVNRFRDNSEYEEDLIIDNSKALELMSYNTLLVVVDVNRASYTECPELIERARTVVILDHHRQTGDAISNAALSYIEPYASSACELVSEILQYIGDGVKLRPAEADALYSGIMIDTNNFLTKTGVRTFEAAAFLRKNGADVTRIRKMFRTVMTEYVAKAATASSTEIFMNSFAFAVSTITGVESPTVLGAQVANELLNIVNIKASFVFTEYGGKIYISARSIDELNVQVVMEKLGGGGHMSVAGAQLECSLEEAKDKVKTILKTMSEEGEI